MTETEDIDFKTALSEARQIKNYFKTFDKIEQVIINAANSASSLSRLNSEIDKARDNIKSLLSDELSINERITTVITRAETVDGKIIKRHKSDTK